MLISLKIICIFPEKKTLDYYYFFFFKHGIIWISENKMLPSNITSFENKPNELFCPSLNIFTVDFIALDGESFHLCKVL